MLIVDTLLDGASVFPDRKPSLLALRDEAVFKIEDFETKRFGEGTVLTIEITGGRGDLNVQLDIE